MDIARVIGTIVATQKDRRMDSCKICLIQPLDYNLQPSRPPLVALDATAMRGTGELVYFCESADAGFCGLPKSGSDVPPEPIPSDASIVGIVDHLDINPKTIRDFG